MRSILMSAAAHIVQSKVGQVQYDAAGTYQWTAPEGVTKISVAMVGGGGESNNGLSNKRTGEGGHLRYINDVAVIPGQTYTINVGAPGYRSPLRTVSAAFGFSTLSAIGGNVQGANGGESIYNTNNAWGGSAGVNARDSDGFDLRTFTSVKSHPSVKDRTKDRTGLPAGGGGGNYTVGDSRYASAGAPGAVRIIWGDGRGFPDRNIGDI